MSAKPQRRKKPRAKKRAARAGGLLGMPPPPREVEQSSRRMVVRGDVLIIECDAVGKTRFRWSEASDWGETRDVVVWRSAGRESTEPLGHYFRRAERVAKADEAAVKRDVALFFNSGKGGKAPRQVAIERREKVLALARAHAKKGRHLNSFIARKLGITPERVGQIRRQEEKKSK